jgi:hypothetical protein
MLTENAKFQVHKKIKYTIGKLAKNMCKIFTGAVRFLLGNFELKEPKVGKIVT